MTPPEQDKPRRCLWFGHKWGVPLAGGEWLTMPSWATSGTYDLACL